MTRCDMSLDDLGYDIEECIRAWNRYQFEENTMSTVQRLSEEMRLLRVAKSQDDADILASYAMEQLYPDMSRVFRDLGYEIASVYAVRIVTTRSKRIRCDVVLTVT